MKIKSLLFIILSFCIHQVNAQVSISITTPSLTACQNSTVTYKANVTGGGTSPVYQWKRNGVDVGTNSNIYVKTQIYVIDTVWCTVTTSSSGSAASNTLIVTAGMSFLNSTYNSSSGIHICHGSNTGLLTFSSNLPVNIIRWDTMNTSAVNRNWGAVPNTNATYTSGPLNAFGFAYGGYGSVPNNANFRVVFNFVGCVDTMVSQVLNFVVDPTTVNKGWWPEIQGRPCVNCLPVCFGTRFTGGLYPAFGNVSSNFIIQESVSPFTTWTTPNLDSVIELKKMRVIAKSGVCPADTQLGLDITVAPQLIAGKLNGNQTICKGSPSGIVYSGGSGGGGIYSWKYSQPPYTSWGELTNTGYNTTPSNFPILKNTKFAAVVGNQYSISHKCGLAYTDTVMVSFDSKWLGTNSADWNSASNWSCGIPVDTTDVTINSGSPNSPIVSTIAAANNINLGAGASLFVNSGGNISIGSNIAIGSSAVFNPRNGIVNFVGNSLQTIPGANYGKLNISGSASKLTTGPITISNLLNLDSVKLLIGNNSITIDSAASLNYTTGYVVTNGTGSLIKKGIGSAKIHQIPIGSSINSYNGVEISNSGTTDNFSFRVMENVYPNYTGLMGAGLPLTSNVVNKTWFVRENNIGGSNANISLVWNSANELSGFNRTSSYISQYNGTNWVGSTVGAAFGSDPYKQTLNGITSFYPMSVASGGTLFVENINFEEAFKKITISPNPFNNQIQLNFNSENNSIVKLILIDALGREVYNKSLPTLIGANNLTIDDIAILKAGIYFAHLESNGVVTKTVKMLKN